MGIGGLESHFGEGAFEVTADRVELESTVLSPIDFRGNTRLVHISYRLLGENLNSRYRQLDAFRRSFIAYTTGSTNVYKGRY